MCVRAHVHPSGRACRCAGVRACGRAGVRACGRAGVRACGQAVLYISSTNLDNLKAYCLVSYVKLGTPFWV